LIFLTLLIGQAGPGDAAAQQVHVQNGATVRVANGGVVDLESTTMNFGDANATARLVETNAGRVTGGLLTATRTVGSPSAADPAGLGIEISTSKDLGDLTVTRGHTVQTGNGNASIGRYYELSPSEANSDLDATLTHTYADAELNGLSEGDLEMFKSTDGGSTWSEEGVDERDTTANAITLGGVASLSRWTLGSESAPLPVELISFEGTVTEQGVRLTWQTATETNNAGFEVQHRRGAAALGASGAAPANLSNEWTDIGFVESKAEGGASTRALSYRFLAEDLPVGTHEFRLRQVDTDGTETAHDPVSVTVQMHEDARLSSPAPHPVTDRATVSFAVREQKKTTLRLYNTLGQRVATVYRGRPPAGEQRTVRLPVQKLAPGMYFLRLTAGGQSRTRKVTVVR
jgi:hypothetical protein